jgi:hypothetical protein
MSYWPRPVKEHVRLMLNSKDAARALSISPRLLAHLTKKGEICPIRLGGRGLNAKALRYPIEELQRHVREQQQAQYPEHKEAHEPGPLEGPSCA